MSEHHPVPAKVDKPDDSLRGWVVRHKLVTLLFLAAAAFYLFAENQAHVWGILPWLILLACPLMHVFMHHRHGGHVDHDESERE